MAKPIRPIDWLISDPHLNHKMLSEKGYRPEGFTELIQENWRALVRPFDRVIVMGDVIIGQASQLIHILASLPGRKVLVRGNHDKEKDQWYIERGFDMVVNGLLIGEAWITHCPQRHLPDGATINVHGHLHDSKHHGDRAGFPKHCKLFSLEQTNYKPVPLETFVGFELNRRRVYGITDLPEEF